MQRFICTKVVLFVFLASNTLRYSSTLSARLCPSSWRSSIVTRSASKFYPGSIVLLPSSVKTVTSAQSSGCSSLPFTCHCHFSTGTARCWSWPRIQYLLSNRPPTCSLVQKDCGLVTPYYNHFNLQPDPDLLSDTGDQLCRLFLLGCHSFSNSALL